MHTLTTATTNNNNNKHQKESNYNTVMKGVGRQLEHVIWTDQRRSWDILNIDSPYSIWLDTVWGLSFTLIRPGQSRCPSTAEVRVWVPAACGGRSTPY